MGVQKFRTAEEMSAAVVVTPTAGSFERFLRHCARYRMLVPKAYPRGVFRFASIEDTQLARERVTIENARRTRQS